MPLLSELSGGRRFKVLQPEGGCRTCPRMRKEFTPADLQDTEVLVVGASPFDTTSLRETLSRAGIPRFSTTYTIHCKPPKERGPQPKELKSCLAQYVEKEVRGYPIVVLAGSTAINAFFPGYGAAKLRGNVAWHPDFPGQRFYPMYSQGATQDKRKAQDYERQVNRLGRIVRGDRELKFPIIQGDAYWDTLEEILTRHKVNGLDIETAYTGDDDKTGLKSWRPGSRIRSIAISGGDEVVAFAHEGEPHFVAALDRIANELNSNTKKIIVGQHIGFDVQFLEAETGIQSKAPFVFDVGALYYQYKGYQMPGLKTLVSNELDGYRFLCYDPTKEEDLTILANYNGEDVIYPVQLYKNAAPELHPKTRDLYIRVSGPSDLALQRVTARGFWFMEDNWRKHKAELETERAQKLEEWANMDSEFIPEAHLSDKGLKEYLFDLKGLPVLKRTGKKNEPSLDKYHIKDLIRQTQAPFLETYLRISQIDTRLSTFVNPYEHIVDGDGRVHADYPNTSTKTGRLSSRNPNFQNIPRDKSIRAFFGVPPGMKLLQADFSQIELRIAMCLAGDPVGIAAYQAGEDLHTRTARSFTEGREPTKKERTDAKPVNFSLIYGGSPEGLQAYAQNEYGIIFSIDEAHRFTHLFFDTYAKLRPWHARERALMKELKGNFMSVVGHTHYYNNWNAKDDGARGHEERSWINSTCQGPAGYFGVYTIILAQREFQRRNLERAHIVNTVHDSILVEYDPADEEEVVWAIKDAVKQVESWVKSWFVVPLVIDFEGSEVGGDWGHLKGMGY